MSDAYDAGEWRKDATNSYYAALKSIRKKDMIEIELPWPPKMLWPNRSQGRHWGSAYKYKMQARKDGHAATVAAEGWHNARLDWKAAKLEIEFHPPDKRRRDWDNMVASLKSYIDGISAALDIDDSLFEMSFRKCQPVKFGKVIVKVTNLEAERKSI